MMAAVSCKAIGVPTAYGIRHWIRYGFLRVQRFTGHAFFELHINLRKNII